MKTLRMEGTVENREKLAIALKLTRTKMELTQQELGNKAGVSHRIISCIETQRPGKMRATTVVRLARATGVNPNEWLELAGIELKFDNTVTRHPPPYEKDKIVTLTKRQLETIIYAVVDGLVEGIEENLGISIDPGRQFSKIAVRSIYRE